MENEKFIATNRQFEKVIIDKWKHVCDLDKRIWNIRRWEVDAIKKPLARVKWLGLGWKEIWSHQDLVGVGSGR